MSVAVEQARAEPRGAALRYGVALLAAAGAIAITRFAGDLVPQAVFIFAFAAVALSAWFGGAGPGILTAVVSVVGIDYWVIVPANFATPLIPIAIFILVASLFSAVVEQTMEARRTADRLTLDLAEQTDDLQQQATELEEQNAEMQEMTAQLEEAEELAQHERQRFQLLLDSHPDVLIAYDKEWRYTYINPRGQELLRAIGKDPDRVLGTTLWEQFPDVEKQYRAEMQRAMDEDRIFATSRTFPETGISLESRIIPMPNGAVNHTRDVSAERLMNETRARLAAIVDSSEDAIIGKTLDGIIESWNAAATRLFGHTPEEAIGRSVLLLIPPELHAEEARILERVRRGERIGNYETTRLHKSGRRLMVSLSVSPVRGLNGEIVGAAKIARDITERREAEGRQALLATLMQGFAASLDLDTIMFTLARTVVPQFADWCVVDCLEGENSARGVRRVAMMHRDPSRQMRLHEISHRWPPNVSRPTFGRLVLASQRSVLLERVSEATLAQFSADEEHAAEIRELGVSSMIVAPLQARGRLLGVALFARAKQPFTERDRDFADEIARRASLAADSAQLYREALAANEAKGNFLATMSHELRTPLTAIIGYEELLADGITGPVTQQQMMQLRRIKDSANHLLMLIDEILTFSRVEAGREVLHLAEEPLAPIIEQSVAMLRPIAEDRGLTLTSDVSAAPATLCTDPGKLRQIVLNLLSNAVKFTEEGGIVVTARSQNEHVLIDVTDSGIGIPQEHHERIFDPFWQVEQRATRRVGGTGLGLSVSRRLARMLGGDVTVESSAANGTTFRVRLPLAGPKE